MGDVYVYSTLTADNIYGTYTQGAADLPKRDKQVLIRGGANVAGRKHLITPRGVATRISDEQLAVCREDVTFLHHEKNGFLKVEAIQADADHVAADMEGRDLAAPLVPQDIEDGAPRVATNVETVPEPLAPVAPAPTTTRRR